MGFHFQVYMDIVGGVPDNQKLCIPYLRFIILKNKIKLPPAEYLLGGVEGHGETGHEEVCKGEADEEVVVDAPELPVEVDTGDHQEVGEDGHQDDQDEHHRFADIEEGDVEVLADGGGLCAVVGGGVEGGHGGGHGESAVVVAHDETDACDIHHFPSLGVVTPSSHHHLP